MLISIFSQFYNYLSQEFSNTYIVEAACLFLEYFKKFISKPEFFEEVQSKKEKEELSYLSNFKQILATILNLLLSNVSKIQILYTESEICLDLVKLAISTIFDSKCNNQITASIRLLSEIINKVNFITLLTCPEIKECLIAKKIITFALSFSEEYYKNAYTEVKLLIRETPQRKFAAKLISSAFLKWDRAFSNSQT